MTARVRSEAEQAMAKNVQQALAIDLQSLSAQFRASQAAYLKRMPSIISLFLSI